MTWNPRENVDCSFKTNVPRYKTNSEIQHFLRFLCSPVKTIRGREMAFTSLRSFYKRSKRTLGHASATASTNSGKSFGLTCRERDNDPLKAFPFNIRTPKYTKKVHNMPNTTLREFSKLQTSFFNLEWPP